MKQTNHDLGLRWQARLGQLSPWARWAALASGVLLVLIGVNLWIAIQNPWWPEVWRVGELSDRPERLNRYVTVSGIALHEIGPIEERDAFDRVVARYYFLMDGESGSAVLVKAAGEIAQFSSNTPVTVTGMTRYPYEGAQKFIDRERTNLSGAGIGLVKNVYLVEGEAPKNPLGLLFIMSLFWIVSVVGAMSVFFPRVAFRPRPLTAWRRSLSRVPTDIRAYGRFTRLERGSSEVKPGRPEQVIYGLPVSVNEKPEGRLWLETYDPMGSTDKERWGIVLDPATTVEATVGMLYGWRDVGAVALQYRDGEGQMRTVICAFNQPATLEAFCNRLTARGFPLKPAGPGEPGPVITKL